MNRSVCIMQHKKVIGNDNYCQRHGYLRVVMVPEMLVKQRACGDHQQKQNKRYDRPSWRTVVLALYFIAMHIRTITYFSRNRHYSAMFCNAVFFGNGIIKSRDNYY